MKIKIPKLFTRKKLRATTARKPLRIAATADYEEMAEPNMKLSRALLIVLLLHVVAVAGIIAFNAIKTHQSPAPVALTSAVHPSPIAGSTVKPATPISHSVAAQKEIARHSPPHTSRSPAKPISKEERKAEPAKPSDTTAAGESRKVYVVAKGDNPVTIAKKLNVSYDDLIALNQIEDPRKIQIGQKLLIPSKPAKATKK